jgi:protein required for attachment to host cells
MSTHRAEAWCLVSDQRLARLLRATRTERGTLHLEEAARVAEEWDDSLHREPASRAGPSGHSYENIGHIPEERLHRFGKQVARWLERELRARDVDRLVLFASERLMGELRQRFPAWVRSRVDERLVDLGHLSPAELARHPALGHLENESEPV